MHGCPRSMVSYRVKAVIVAVLVVVVTFSALESISLNKAFPFSQALLTKEITPEGTYDERIFQINGTDGSFVGTLDFRINDVPNSTFQRMEIFLGHSAGIFLDSVTFRFYTPLGKQISVYLCAMDQSFHTTIYKEQNGVIAINYKIENDFVAQGALRSDLIIENSFSDQVICVAELSMHQPALLQLTSMETGVYIQNILLHPVQK
jgi:hypothetical protein